MTTCVPLLRTPWTQSCPRQRATTTARSWTPATEPKRSCGRGRTICRSADRWADPAASRTRSSMNAGWPRLASTFGARTRPRAGRNTRRPLRAVLRALGCSRMNFSSHSDAGRRSSGPTSAEQCHRFQASAGDCSGALPFKCLVTSPPDRRYRQHRLDGPSSGTRNAHCRPPWSPPHCRTARRSGSKVKKARTVAEGRRLFHIGVF